MVLLPSFSSILLAASAYAATGSLQQITNFSPNPSNAGMFVYKPAKLASPPPVLVAIHYCGGSAQAYFSGTQYATLADQYGYIVVYPNVPANQGGCWDVASNATLTHNGGSDSLGIVSMAKYAVSTWGGDVNRVFVTGTSSGAMMTNVLIGAYPDMFQGGAAFSGVPYGCFAGPTSWNSQCAQGQLIKTAQQWGDMVRAAYPGYTGPRPKMQVWHGTADTTLYPQNYYEEVKQWTNVFNYSQTAEFTTQNQPLAGYTNSTYGPLFQAYLAQGVGHTVPEQAGDVLTFFGLNAPASGSPAPPVTSTVPPVTSTPPPQTTTVSTSAPSSTAVGTVAHWGQCGGIGWTGGTVCVAPFTCQAANAYYSQCL